MQTKYVDNLDGISELSESFSNCSDLLDGGFFVGWQKKPSDQQFFRLLKSSYRIWLAIDIPKNKLVGFITAISDGVLAAYIPLLEVLPAYQGQGIGSELTSRMFNSLKDFYMGDICFATTILCRFIRNSVHFSQMLVYLGNKKGG